MLTEEQRLIIAAVERYIDASNAFTDIHDRIRHTITSPFHPAAELAEIFSHETFPLYERLAEEYGLDLKAKRLRLQGLKRCYALTG